MDGQSTEAQAAGGRVRLLVATSNPNKVREVREILEGRPVDVVGLNEYPGSVLPEESGTSFTENARLKARAAAEQTGQITLADDSGLCVDAMGGAPGIHSNRFLGGETTPEERNDAVLRLLGPTPHEERTARFACAACIVLPGEDIIETLETCDGIIARRPAGDGGFGYDPIFFIPELNKTLAEATADEKNSLSHRGKAVRKVVDRLLRRLGIG